MLAESRGTIVESPTRASPLCRLTTWGLAIGPCADTRGGLRPCDRMHSFGIPLASLRRLELADTPGGGGDDDGEGPWGIGPRAEPPSYVPSRGSSKALPPDGARQPAALKSKP